MQIKNTKKIMQIIAKLDELLDLLDEQKFSEFSKKYEAWDHHLALLSSCFSEKADPVIPGAKSLVEKRALLKNVAVQEAYVRGFVAEIFGWSTVPAIWYFICLFCAGLVGYVSQEELDAITIEENKNER